MNDKAEHDTESKGNGRIRNVGRFAVLAGGLGLGAAIAYLFSKARSESLEQSTKTRPSNQIPAQAAETPEHIVDDRGTTQEKAAQILRKLRDLEFEASDEKLALALGRPAEEIAAWNAGLEVIDDDVVIKARGIAHIRGVHVE